MVVVTNAWLNALRLRSGRDAMLEGVTDRAGSVGYAELAIDVRQMELDGVLAHPHLAADRGRCEARGDRLEDCALALGEGGTGAVSVGVAQRAGFTLGEWFPGFTEYRLRKAHRVR